MKNQSIKISWGCHGRRGFTLLPCIMLTSILLAISLATLRIGHDFRTLTAGNVDRLIASEAAEAALHDAHQHLTMMDDPLSLKSNNVVYEFGSITGDSFLRAVECNRNHRPSISLKWLAPFVMQVLFELQQQVVVCLRRRDLLRRLITPFSCVRKI